MRSARIECTGTATAVDFESKAMKKFWRIEGCDSTDPFFDLAIPIHHASQGLMEVMLQRLACRHLSENEIVQASVRRSPGSKGQVTVHSLLETQTFALSEQNKRFCITVGNNPYYTASVWTESELRSKYPKLLP